MEIDIKQLIKKIIDKWYIILITVILCVAIALILTSFITPMYSSTVAFYVINNPPEGVEYTQSSLVTANESLAKNYMELISSNYVLDGAAQKLKTDYGINYSSLQIQRMISSSQKSDTGVFNIKITNASKSEALIIATIISEEAVVKINEISKREDCVRIIRTGQEAKTPDSPNLRTNIIFAIMVGICISFGLIFIIIYTNNKIKTDSDLKNRYEYPVIGQIPKWDID